MAICFSAPNDVCDWLGPEWANRSGNRIGRAPLRDRPFFISDRDVTLWKNPKSWKVSAIITAGEPILKLGPVRSIGPYQMFAISGGGAVELDKNLREATPEDFSINEDVELITISKRRKRRRHQHTTVMSESHQLFNYRLRHGYYKRGYVAFSQLYLTQKYNRVCFIDALRLLSIKAPYRSDGPFWVLADGNVILKDFGKVLRKVDKVDEHDMGKYVVHSYADLTTARGVNVAAHYEGQQVGHFYALRVHSESWNICDRRHRFSSCKPLWPFLANDTYSIYKLENLHSESCPVRLIQCLPCSEIMQQWEMHSHQCVSNKRSCSSTQAHSKKRHSLTS